MSKLYEELKDRGLIYQYTGQNPEEIFNQSRTCYLGMDPTAPAIHIGYLVPIMLCRVLAKHGFKIIILLGGATAKVGDPTGKTQQRKMLDEETIEENKRKLTEAIYKFFPESTIVNNADWLSELKLMDFLTDFARNISVNSLIKTESFAKRLNEELPLSMLEIFYPILQGYDFYHLNQESNCTLQLGGSDQWSNILYGVDMIKRFSEGEKDVHGVTCPLLLNSQGEKMGKTVSGAVWMDSELFDPFDFWQYWRNIDDKSCHQFMHLLTELNSSERQKILDGDINECKKFLATYLTEFVHGEEIAKDVTEKAAKIFEQKDLSNIEVREINDSAELFKVVTQLGWTESNGESKKLIQQGGITINDEKITDTMHILSDQDILCKGKKLYIRVSTKKDL